MLEQIVQRVVRIIKFDMTVFEEIEHDENANTEAAIIVIVSALLSALGAGISRGSFGAFIFSLLVSVLLGWLLWSWLTMFIGTRLFGGEADFWEMARMLGYASAPGVLGILGVIPCLGMIIGLIVWILSLVIGFFAVREALDIPTEKAIITIIIGWVVVVIVNLVLGGLFVGASILA